ncbi:MAG: aminotransferase class I/II-fold pyridoxal phosphate-dependent enzyme, partial [Gemmatimonadales bacterium]
MERRNFLRVGLAAGAWGVGAAVAVTPARGAQPAVLPLRRRAPGPLRLSANENPLGIAPSARQAVMRGMAAANRYPDQVRGDLIDAIAEHLGVTPEHIVLGAGSTDVLRMLVLSTHDRGGRFVVATPTFEDIVGYSRPFGPRLDEVPLRPDGSHDIPRMRESAERGSDPVLVFVCNPNNPTGTLTRCAEVDEWIESAPERVTF